MSLYYNCYGDKLGLRKTSVLCLGFMLFFKIKDLKAPVIYGKQWKRIVIPK